MTIRRSFSFDDTRDAALLAWLDGRANASQVVRDALYAQMAGEVTLSEVLAAVRELGDRIGQHSLTASLPSNDGNGDAPGTAIASTNLSHLGL